MDEKNFRLHWIKTLNNESIKIFPNDFLASCELENYALPGKGLLIGNEFFGEFELIDADGKEILRVDSYDKAKFIIYSNRSKPRVITVPINISVIKEMNLKYEAYLDSIIKRIEHDYQKHFPGSKNYTDLLNQIFKHLNLIRMK